MPELFKYKDNLKIKRILIGLFYLSVGIGVALNFMALMPIKISQILVMLSLLFGYTAILFYIVISYNWLESNKVFYYFLVVLIYMLIVGIMLSHGRWRSSESFGWFINQDLRYVMYMALGFSFASEGLFDRYHKMMQFLGVIALIFGAIALKNYKFDINLVASGNRIGTWDLPYYLWWLSECVYVYNFSYSKITGKSKVIGYGCLIAYLILGLLFLKRSCLVNVIAIIVITTQLKQTKKSSIKNNFKFLLFLMLFGITLYFAYKLAQKNVGIPYVNAIINSLLGRFENGNLQSYDRSIEKNLYFITVSKISIITGQGLGNYIITDRLINALHIGFYNIVYKGGVVFLIFWIYIIINVAKKIFIRKNLSEIELVCLATALSAFLSLVYEFSFTYTILIIGYATPIAYITQAKIRRRDSKK